MSIFSDKFFADKAVGALWDVAVSIKRGNPLPLDKDAVVHGVAELNAVAAGAVSYPGQIIAVIEDAVYEGEGEDKVLVTPESTTLYYLDHNKTPREVGKVPVGDDLSIEVNNEKISLHDFGKAFYKYIAEVKDGEGNVTAEAHYDRVEVSDENPWKAGLEPKVATQDGKLVIGWYEPNPTTIEGVNDQVTAVQGTVEDLANSVGTPAADGAEATGLYKEIDNVEVEVSGVKEEVVEIQTILEGTEEVEGLVERVGVVEETLKDVYTKTETNTAIAEAVASAGHLKREIVEELPTENINVDTIYMVKDDSLSADKDAYDEYMYINGQFEKIGDTHVDLEPYAKSEDVTEEISEAVKDFATSNEVSSAISEALADYKTAEDITQEISDAVSPLAIKTEVQSALDLKADKTELSSLATKQELSEGLSDKVTSGALEVALGDYLTEEEVLAELAKKLDASKMEEITNALNAKLDLQTWESTLPGLATEEEVANTIGNAPTKNEESGEYEGATGIYTNIYTKDEITKLIADITGGESAADVLAALNAYKTSNDPRVKALENAINGIPANVEGGTEAVPGLIERVENLEEKPEYELPIATVDILGGVKSSDSENQITVASDGKMEVNSLNVNKLTQTNGDYIVLYGGSATINI